MATFPILSIEQFDEKQAETQCYVNVFSEHLRKFHTQVTHPHKHDFFLTVIFTYGTGFHEIDFHRFDVSPGTVFFLHPGQTHYWEFSQDIEGIILFHSLSFYQFHFSNHPLTQFPFFFSKQNAPVLRLAEADIPPVISQFERLLQESGKKQLHKYLKIAGLLAAVYVDLSRKYEDNYPELLVHNHHYSRLFEAFESLVDAFFRSEKSALFYADKLAISTKHLNRICKECVGKTSTQVIADRILLEAKRLLSVGDRPLESVAEELGFNEYSYFSRFFKLHCKESPGSFRKGYK